jgi:ABC-type Na+ efflux pump permease subunit
MLIAAVAPWFVFALQHPSDSQRATGIAALVFMGLDKLASPLFWIIAIPLFVAFFAASRLGSKTLRVILFWTPTVLVSALGFGFFSLVLALWLHSRNS